MNTKHTPAPWKVRFYNEDNIESGFFVEAKNNNMSNLIYGIEILQDDFGEHNGYPAEQRLADAKLISAAPELLEALIICSKSLATYGSHPIIEKIVNNAIKKATE